MDATDKFFVMLLVFGALMSVYSYFARVLNLICN